MAPTPFLFMALTAFLAFNTVHSAPQASSVTASASVAASTDPNGPYSNPYDTSSQPVTWPGTPASGQSTPTSRPGPAFPSGGLPQFASKFKAPMWLPKGKNSLAPGLSQGNTNGNSQWGVIDRNNLPFHRFPIGNGRLYNRVAARPTVTVTEPGPTPTKGPCGTAPDTGVTRTYNFAVSYATIAPDGVAKNGLVVNGAFPGPLIEANWGDWVQITVTNNLPNEGTSLHWHGLLQSTTPWFDGVPAVSQCPIPPNGTFTYLWQADLYGTSWYHSHYSAQYAGGALGPIVIHGPQTAAYDIDLGPVVLSDWYHQDYFTLVNQTMSGGVPQSNNNLINGKMNYPCQNTTLPCTPNAGISKFRFQYGKKHRLRLINTSAEGLQKFSIDGHNLTVIANDFVPVVPYTTDVVTLGIGQRTDIIVQAKSQLTGAYWMRANLSPCSFTDGVSPEAVAGVFYPLTSSNTVPTTNSTVSLGACQNDDLSETVSWCPVTPDPNPPTTDTVEITFGSNGTNFVWFMNGESFRGDYNDPTLLAVGAGNTTFEPEWNVFDFGTNTSVRIVVKNTFEFSPHPMHLHGHNFHVLAQGFGDWDGNVTNPSNTQMRDVQLVPAAQLDGTPAYIVLQWQQDNPAVWPFHCHIAWHVSAGLYINVLERPDDIMKRNFPSSVSDNCRAWGDYTGNNIPDQIDSGL